MGNLNISIVSPASTFFEGEAEAAQIPVHDGLIGVLPGHAALVSVLGIGVLTVRQKGKEERIIVDGGFLEVKNNRVIVLANNAEYLKNVDVKKARVDFDEAVKITATTDSLYERKMNRLASLRIRMKYGSAT